MGSPSDPKWDAGIQEALERHRSPTPPPRSSRADPRPSPPVCFGIQKAFYNTLVKHIICLHSISDTFLDRASVALNLPEPPITILHASLAHALKGLRKHDVMKNIDE